MAASPVSFLSIQIYLNRDKFSGRFTPLLVNMIMTWHDHDKSLLGYDVSPDPMFHRRLRSLVPRRLYHYTSGYETNHYADISCKIVGSGDVMI